MTLDIDLAQVRRTLRQGVATPTWQTSWLEPSWNDPDAFRAGLYRTLAKRSPAAKTAEPSTFDFYHDAVTVNIGQRRAALIAEEEIGDTIVSYDELHARCGGLASVWRELGAAPGQCLALLLPIGPDYLVALLTALRLGVTVCALPPLGREATRRRLESLEHDFVIGTPRQLADLGPSAAAVLPTQAQPAPESVTSHAYAPDDPVLRLYSAFGTDPALVVDLPARALHFWLFRDAWCTFALDATDTVAMPNFEELVVQPTMLLSVMFAGARWSQWGSQLSSRRGRKPSEVLSRHTVTVLGVRTELREELLQEGQWTARSVRLWLRLLTDRFDATRWEQLAAVSRQKRVSAMNVAYSAATGGVVLAGPPSTEPLGLTAAPPPGQTWQLDELAGRSLPALGNTGQYVATWDGKPLPEQPRLVVEREATRWLCGGSLDVGPDAMSVPVDWMNARLCREPDVTRASIVITPGSIAHQAWVTVLLFVDPLRELSRTSDLAARTRRCLREEFGEAFEPTRVEVLPLRPRLHDAEVDHGWCRSQYLSGSLSTKARSELFRALSRLASLVMPINPN